MLHYSLLISLPAALGIIVIAKPIISLIYGQNYLLAVIPLYVLAFLIISSTANLFPIFFSAKGKPEIPAKIMLISTILNLALNYSLIKIFLSINQIYATLGAAIATVLSISFFYASLIFLSKKNLNLRINYGFVSKPLLAALIMAFFLGLLNKFISLNWIWIIMEIVFGAIFYFFVLYLIKGITNEDYLLIKKLSNQ